MDTTALSCALPKNGEEYIYLLFEAGAQDLELFHAFYSKHANKLYSLYLHPQLTGFQDYGPWLLEVKDKAQLKYFLDILPGYAGVITSPRHLSSVAIQLSRGCTIVVFDGATSLVRFYASHVIEVLAECADQDWHKFLFCGLTQWWVPEYAQWRQITISPSSAESPTDPIVRIDKTLWQKISDKPEVGNVLAEWKKIPSSRHYPPCTQRSMVIKALNRARKVGLTVTNDQMLYALCYLSGNKSTLDSEPFVTSLQRVIEGHISLKQAFNEIHFDN